MTNITNVSSADLHDKWFFALAIDLPSSISTPLVAGDYAIVWETDTVWVFDTDTLLWVNSWASWWWITWGFWEATMQDYMGTSVIGVLGKYDSTRTWILSKIELIAESIPVGSNLICELRKNSYTTWNVLSAVLQIATTDVLTNWKIYVSATWFTSTAIADGDYFVAYLSEVWSTTPAINAKVVLYYT